MKTKNQRGFTHNMALLIIGVLVLGVISFSGVKVYQNKNSESARAAGPVQLHSGSWGQMALCRTSGSVVTVRYRWTGMTLANGASATYVSTEFGGQRRLLQATSSYTTVSGTITNVPVSGKYFVVYQNIGGTVQKIPLC